MRRDQRKSGAEARITTMDTTMDDDDDIVICEETREKVERRLELWKYVLKRRGMKVSRSKTEYLCINGGNDDETVKMDDTKVPRVKEFKNLGSTV